MAELPTTGSSSDECGNVAGEPLESRETPPYRNLCEHYSRGCSFIVSAIWRSLSKGYGCAEIFSVGR